MPKGNSTCTDSGSPEKEGPEHMPPTTPAPNWWDPIVILTCGLVFCTLVQVVILVLQTRILGQTIRMSRSDQRAWVGGVEPRLHLESPLKATIALRNFGQSPALEIRSNVELKVRGLEDPAPDLPAIQETGSTTVLQPTQWVTAQGTEEGGAKTADVIGAKVAVYFSGAIAYKDIFTEDHRTTFAYVFIPRPNGDGTWMTLDVHNTAS
jgi:hypothetical protein